MGRGAGAPVGDCPDLACRWCCQSFEREMERPYLLYKARAVWNDRVNQVRGLTAGMSHACVDGGKPHTVLS